MLWLSDLTYRMKDNARMFFLITIVFTVAFSAAGTLVNLSIQMMNQAKESNPFTISYRAEPEGFKGITPQAGQEIIEEELKKADVRFQKIKAPYYTKDISHDFLDVIKLTDYNRLAKALKQPLLTLKPGEAFVIDSRPKKFKNQDMTVGKTIRLDDESYKITSSTENRVMSDQVFSIVIPDNLFNKNTKVKEPSTYVAYSVPEWDRSFPNSQAVKVGQTLKKKLHMPAYMFLFQARDALFNEIKQFMSTTLFIGLFISIIFLICSGSFLYFRLFTDLQRDQKHYQSISKIGLTANEMKKSVTIQIALLFFIPFGIAVVHSFVALVSMQKVFHFPFESIVVPSLITIGSFLVLQIIYFTVVRYSYLQKLKRSIS